MSTAPQPSAFSPYTAKRPPVGIVCQVALGAIVLSAIVLAAQIPRLSELTVPIVLAGVAWVLFLAALLASCFRGALAPVFFLAVCFVLAMSSASSLEIIC
jgi:uncharacterized membrane protein YhhN